jgi:hypothetical protein
LNAHVTIDCVSFIEGEFRDEKGELSSSVARCLLHLAKYSSSSLNFQLFNLDQIAITDSLFTEFCELSIRSLREWENVYHFLDECFIGKTINLTQFLDNSFGKSSSDIVTAIKKVSEVCAEVDIDILKLYLFNDVLTFEFLSAISGNSTALRWFSKVCESFDNSKSLTDLQNLRRVPANSASEDADVDCKPQILSDEPKCGTPSQENKSSTRTFILVCVMLKVLPSKSLETLLLSMATHVDMLSSDVRKALTLLSESLQSTLSIKPVPSNE